MRSLDKLDEGYYCIQFFYALLATRWDNKARVLVVLFRHHGGTLVKTDVEQIIGPVITPVPYRRRHYIGWKKYEVDFFARGKQRVS